MELHSPAHLSRPEALAAIRELAGDSSRIFIVRHAIGRMIERSVSRSDVENCLRKGVIDEGPFLNSHGHWQVTMARRAGGERTQCVVAIEWSRRLLVITVY